MAASGDTGRCEWRTSGVRMVVTVFLLRSLLLVTVTDAAEDEAKPLAKPHPYLVSTPPLTEEDFQVFVALQKPCTFDAKKTALGDLAKQLSELVNVEIKIDGDGLRRAKPKPIDPDVRFNPFSGKFFHLSASTIAYSRGDW